MDRLRDRLKQLDLLSGFGAGVLGAGLALLFADWLKPFAIPALLIGMLAHGWAMFEKSRLEKAENLPIPGWSIVAQWSCWLLLVFLTLYVSYELAV